MVCEILILETTKFNDPEKLRHLAVPQHAGVIGVVPGEKSALTVGEQTLTVECFGDNSASAVEYILEDCPSRPLNTKVLFDTNDWFPIPTYEKNTWFLLRHKKSPGFSNYQTLR